MREMSPQEAADRWIDRKRTTARPASITTLHYRVKQFVEWCEAADIESLSDLTTWDLDDYEADRREQVNVISLKNQLGTVKRFLEWAATRELVDERVPDAIEPPTVPKADESSDIKFDADDAIPQLQWFRESTEYGSRRHAILEVLWHVGCRLGSLRGLDLRDYIADDETGEYYLDFRHRAETGTPLKNGRDGDRPVGLQPEVAAVLDAYIAGGRARRRDDAGREPLFTTEYGRISKNLVRITAYFATAPCLRTACPHDREERACEWFSNNHISKCPSTRSPHQIRTGSISWQLDQGVPMEVVSKRVNASASVIKRHYDKTDPLDEYRKRRRPHLDKLRFPTEGAH